MKRIQKKVLAELHTSKPDWPNMDEDTLYELIGKYWALNLREDDPIIWELEEAWHRAHKPEPPKKTIYCAVLGCRNIIDEAKSDVMYMDGQPVCPECFKRINEEIFRRGENNVTNN